MSNVDGRKGKNETQKSKKKQNQAEANTKKPPRKHKQPRKTIENLQQKPLETCKYQGNTLVKKGRPKDHSKNSGPECSSHADTLVGSRGTQLKI